MTAQQLAKALHEALLDREFQDEYIDGGQDVLGEEYSITIDGVFDLMKVARLTIQKLKEQGID